MLKFARVRASAEALPEWAVQDADGLWGLGLAAGPDDDASVLAWSVEGLPAELRARGRRLDPERVQWLMPLARPGKLICLGLNYAAHAAEGGRPAPEYPAFFMRGASSLTAHRAPLLRPRVSEQLDYEAELAVVIGRQARHLTAHQALSVVAGYACFNDGSLRDYQRRSSQWTIGKNFDATGGFGPWLVPASELPPGAHGLKIQARLNGKVMQSDDTSHMMVSVAQALVLLTEAMTLEPGDVIAMGTPAGVGFARTPPVWMVPGDLIEIDIEGVGVLANTVVQA